MWKKVDIACKWYSCDYRVYQLHFSNMEYIESSSHRVIESSGSLHLSNNANIALSAFLSSISKYILFF